MTDHIKIPMEFNKNLRRTMDRKKLTIRELSTKTGVSRSTLSDWLSGTAPRNLEEVRTVARVIGVSFEFLIFGDEDKPLPIDLDTFPAETLFHGYCRIKIERVLPPLKQSGEKGKD